MIFWIQYEKLTDTNKRVTKRGEYNLRLSKNESELKITGERVIEELYKDTNEDYLIYLFHIVTYKFCLSYAKGKKVIIPYTPEWWRKAGISFLKFINNEPVAQTIILSP